ncbi:cyclic nucleotide-binding domain-containing protein [bacterium]|nr:cyclic nucleotide-binding domain-containing protein [bacterium]MCI0604998.1 cyclic nucleotide-binding domain-containing protein [bacterium]
MIDQSFLRNVFLFKNLDETENDRISGLLKEENFNEGDIILTEGHAGNALYVIWSGRVRVSRQFDQEFFVLTELGPHDFFGEMSLIDDFPTSATVDALTETTVLKMSREDFKFLTSVDDELTSKIWESIARSLIRRIRKTGELVKMYYGLNKALCENEQFRELYTSWSFHR